MIRIFKGRRKRTSSFQLLRSWLYAYLVFLQECMCKTKTNLKIKQKIQKHSHGPSDLKRFLISQQVDQIKNAPKKQLSVWFKNKNSGASLVAQTVKITPPALSQMHPTLESVLSVLASLLIQASFRQHKAENISCVLLYSGELKRMIRVSLSF